MHYTIYHATSRGENKNIFVDLSKCGNMYKVAACNMDEWKTLEGEEFSRYDEAEAAFRALCLCYRMETVEEPTQEWSAADFD